MENTDYQINAALGLLHRIGGRWLSGVQTVKNTWTGGYTTPAEYLGGGYEQGATEVLMPADITEATIQQACFYFQRRDSLGLTGQSVQGSSISTYAQDKLLPMVRETMRRYARMVG